MPFKLNPITGQLDLVNSASGGAVTSVSASSPLASSGGTTPNITIQSASTIQAGYLSAADFNTFNNKQSGLTFGSVSTITSGITITNGTNSTVGPNIGINIQSASTIQNGLLTSTDWNTFNSKQASVSAILPLVISANVFSLQYDNTSIGLNGSNQLTVLAVNGGTP